MCIVAKDVHIAKKDITVYVLRGRSLEGIFSPFYDYMWKLEKFSKPQGIPILVKLYNNLYEFTYGWFHSFSSKNNAIITLNRLKEKYPEHHNLVVMKAIIPKGSIYAYGTIRNINVLAFNNFKGYASNLLFQTDEIIKE